MPEKTVLDTIEMRWHGLKILRKRLGDKNLDFKNYGGYELFNSKTEFKICSEKINHFNSIIYKHLGKPNCYSIFEPKKLPFKTICGVIFNKYEGQIDTGLMLNNLINLAKKFGAEGIVPLFPLNTDGIDPAGRYYHIWNLTVQNYDDVVVPKPSHGGTLCNCT
jgi:hypothetical protein